MDSKLEQYQREIERLQQAKKDEIERMKAEEDQILERQERAHCQNLQKLVWETFGMPLLCVEQIQNGMVYEADTDGWGYDKDTGSFHYSSEAGRPTRYFFSPLVCLLEKEVRLVEGFGEEGRKRVVSIVPMPDRIPLSVNFQQMIGAKSVRIIRENAIEYSEMGKLEEFFVIITEKFDTTEWLDSAIRGEHEEWVKLFAKRAHSADPQSISRVIDKFSNETLMMLIGMEHSSYYRSELYSKLVDCAMANPDRVCILIHFLRRLKKVGFPNDKGYYRGEQERFDRQREYIQRLLKRIGHPDLVTAYHDQFCKMKILGNRVRTIRTEIADAEVALVRARDQLPQTEAALFEYVANNLPDDHVRDVLMSEIEW